MVSKKEFKEYLERFMEFYDRIKGRRDIKSRVEVLASPANPKSMSILSSQQCEFVATSFFVNKVDEWEGIFEGLEDFAVEIMAVSPSKRGEGREQSIRFVGALSESGILKKLGLTVKGEEKE